MKRTLSMAQVDSPKDPFAAVAAAGSALAGAMAAAVGLDYDHSQPIADSDLKEEDHYTSNPEEFGAARGRSMSGNTGVRPLEESDSSLSNKQHDSVSAVSSASPMPSPKVPSPVEHEPLQPSDNFSSTSEWKQEPAEPTYVYERPTRPQMLPSLSTESGPQDYESDRLRKEIVKSLSPRASRVVYESKDSASIEGSDDHGAFTAPVAMGQNRESAVLPKEYESYWNGSSDEDEVPDQSAQARHIESHQIDDPEASSGHQHPPGGLPRRFSWEQDSQEPPTPEPAPIDYIQQKEVSNLPGDYLASAAPHLTQSNLGHPPSRPADEMTIP